MALLYKCISCRSANLSGLYYVYSVKLEGTVVILGTPDEEGDGGKNLIDKIWWL